MVHQKHKNSSTATADRQQPRIRLLAKLAALIGLIVVIAVAGGVLLNINNQPGRQEQTDYRKLVGNWVRPDGGYIICIRSIDLDGQVQAAYFNPNPINVAQAKIALKDSTVKLFVELRDAGYPGCTYDLSYDKQADQLKGIYYQAAIQEKYDIVFLRK